MTSKDTGSGWEKVRRASLMGLGRRSSVEGTADGISVKKAFQAKTLSEEQQLENERRRVETSQRISASVLNALESKYKVAVDRANHAETCSVCISISDTYSKMAHHTKAQAWLITALDVAQTHSLSTSLLLGALRSLVKLHQKTGDHGEAIKSGEVLLETAQKASAAHFKGEAFHLLAISYEAQGDHSKAMAMDEAYLNLSLCEAQWEVASSAASSANGTREGYVMRGDVWNDWKGQGVGENSVQKVITHVRDTSPEPRKLAPAVRPIGAPFPGFTPPAERQRSFQINKVKPG
mmetsp:Transcript_51264/g.122012  ORF Transcript_51264/g.122012 Transcript_51264/m.122012 type:complete len:293 (-) Transcript_51264:197-1075(-)|eukprot:CAMPEP_0180150930 /NCGR_PEP_ID=MMETSP0986-20121125/21818_1 /TAXON_ID=697907 /ORGANISM="non described non described, Strain CCMP2293" /LENGTH=292 /DNA_ID=CAMNT_0022098111 /DNA_START=73 /DNA_END=951 /DNA_ORIENTATION=+